MLRCDAKTGSLQPRKSIREALFIKRERTVRCLVQKGDEDLFGCAIQSIRADYVPIVGQRATTERGEYLNQRGVQDLVVPQGRGPIFNMESVTVDMVCLKGRLCCLRMVGSSERGEVA